MYEIISFFFFIKRKFKNKKVYKMCKNGSQDCRFTHKSLQLRVSKEHVHGVCLGCTCK